MSLDHTPPKPFPVAHFAGVAVPPDFARVVADAAAKKPGFLFEDQLLAWAQKGAECERLHAPKALNPRRKK